VPAAGGEGRPARTGQALPLLPPPPLLLLLVGCLPGAGSSGKSVAAACVVMRRAPARVKDRYGCLAFVTQQITDKAEARRTGFEDNLIRKPALLEPHQIVNRACSIVLLSKVNSSRRMAGDPQAACAAHAAVLRTKTSRGVVRVDTAPGECR
jgi:hypothetical protein